MKVYVQRNYAWDAVQIWVQDRVASGEWIARVEETGELRMEQITEEGIVVNPTITVDKVVAEELMQALWNEGFRPQNETPTDISIDALRNHIKFAEGVVEKLLD